VGKLPLGGDNFMKSIVSGILRVLIVMLFAGCASLPEPLLCESSLVVIKQKADSGDIHSLAILGSIYRKGEMGIKKDYQEAIKYLAPAIKSKDGLAVFELGEMYEFGETVTRDKSKAERLYATALPGLKKLAEGEDIRSQYALGVLYAYGSGGVERNPAAAAKWYEKSARLGYAAAQFQAGLCYENGDGVAKNQTRALLYYHHAAEQGNPMAQFSLGYAYLNGERVGGINIQRSLEYFLEAEKTGLLVSALQAKAQVMIGILYVSLRNEKEAAEWLFKAQRSGDPTAVTLVKDFLNDAKVRASMEKNSSNLINYMASLDKGQPIVVQPSDKQ
jgi:uncharacterized protein